MLKISNVETFYGKIQALRGVDLDVNQGEIVSLIGSNGAGKSTTINMLLGFIEPDSGSATINEINVSNHDESRLNIGYISENVSLYPYLTGYENLEYFCKLSGKNLSKSKLKSLLNECGLEEEVHNRMLSKYSKGMRQKVGIAIALAKKAKVYLLDEPASGLDPLASNELSSLLKKLSDEGATVLMASHDIFRVRETCDRIGIIKNGELIKEMKTSDVSTKELENIYIKYIQN